MCSDEIILSNQIDSVFFPTVVVQCSSAESRNTILGRERIYEFGGQCVSLNLSLQAIVLQTTVVNPTF